MLKRKHIVTLLSIAIAFFVIGTVFNIMTVATGPNGNPWKKVWQAIYELQSEVEALETQIPKRGYISISPAAFNPTEETRSYRLWGSVLEGKGYFVANVQLPHGTTVTNMTVYLYDNSSSYCMDVKLYKYDFHEHHWCIASIDTRPPGETPGYAVLYDDNLLSPEVDNQHYLYYIAIWFDGESPELQLRGIVIEYEYQAR